MADRAISECSGIAASHIRNGSFWVHNDSGDEAKVYLISDKGATITTLHLSGVHNKDYEDIASFTRTGKHFVAVGDIGDNVRRRKELQIHVFNESKSFFESLENKIKPLMTVSFHYEDGIARDCEALTYFPSTGQFLICSKPRGVEVIQGKSAELFAVDVDWTKKSQKSIAKRMGTVAGGLITGMDCTEDGKKLVVQNYLSAYIWKIENVKSLGELNHATATQLVLPVQRQNEAICFSRDGRSIVTTSEGKNQAIYEVAIE